MRLKSLKAVTFALLAMRSPALAQTGTGLTGVYYDTSTFGTLKTTRTYAAVDFDWGNTIPAGTALTSGDTFSVVWSGQIEPEFSDLYTFHLTADDYARLWIDDQLIVGRTSYQGSGAMRGQIRLKAGHRVNLRIECVENSGNAKARLEWESYSRSRQVVPMNRLYPTTEIPNGGSLIGVIINSGHLEAIVSTHQYYSGAFTPANYADVNAIDYLVEVSPDLSPGSWTSAGVTQTRTTTGDVETWQAAYALQPTKRFFFRLKVQIP